MKKRLDTIKQRSRYLASQAWLTLTLRTSGSYWEKRYRLGMTSGNGSYGQLAEFKARVLNAFIAEHSIDSVIEFGCGDGNQLELAQYNRYLGLDVSRTAIDLCSSRFYGNASWSFLWYDPKRMVNISNFLTAELTISLDVIYHLLEDDVYECYLHDLFSTSQRFVIVYSSDRTERSGSRHVRHRKFTEDARRKFPQFRLAGKIDNPHSEESFADFYFFERVASNPA